MRPATIVEIAPRLRPERGPLPTDAELVRRLSQGDAWAKEALYRKYFNCIWGTVLRLLRNRAEVEDVVHDVFVIAFDEFKDLRNPDAVRPWLLQIAVHQVHRRFRRRKLLRLLGLDRSAEDTTLESLVAPGTSPDARAELVRLDAALSKLTDKLRVAWSLRYVEGCSLDEVASACDCSLATAKRRIKDADTLVRDHVTQEEVQDG